ncbi:hypothetical protein [Asticcacaulis taihuensis]|uniref:hypothetical protein n=1 Tax=Asticcacaulis taihuensis TaxID=260084 RepID=UPI003F7B92E2
MTKPARRACYPLPAAIALTVIAVPCAALASSSGPYLNWNAKAQPAKEAPPQTEQVQTATGAYPVPPSPYGQVGDPYARSLRWPAKQTPAVASVSPPPQPDFAPVPTAPIRNPAPVSVSQPVPMAAPKPVTVVPLPAPEPDREDPGLADDPDLTPEALIASQPTPPQAARKSAPAVASAPTPARTETAPPSAAVVSALNSDGAYEVPTTSKYAARIAAARAAQLPTADTPKTGKPEAKQTATAPEPDVSLASQETDHVFIPGEHYTTPADEPRLYSLHRQYGMRPDPITVTPGATGALLTVSPEEGGDPNDDDTANDPGKKSDTDKN